MTVPAVPRREFLGAAGAAAFAGSVRQGDSLTAPVRVGVMGMSRGLALAKNFAACPDVEVRYVCDV